MLGPLKLKCKKMVSFGALSILLTLDSLISKKNHKKLWMQWRVGINSC